MSSIGGWNGFSSATVGIAAAFHGTKLAAPRLQIGRKDFDAINCGV
jgi:hypothetical protein